MSDLIVSSAFFGSVLSLAAYFIGVWMKNRFRLAIFNPILIAVLLCIAFLAVTGISYDTYYASYKDKGYALSDLIGLDGVEKTMEERVRAEGKRQGFYFMDTAEANALAKLLFRPNGTLNPEIVGKPAQRLAELAGFSVPPDTRVLVAREQEAGPTRPYSMEKLCPVLAFFVMDSEEAVLNKCIEVLRHEGSGHTFAIHATDEGVIRRFALKIPVSRFLVNTPAALGGIGATTGLFPALTLGCGAVGGSSSSNNISPLDLINIRRVAWDMEDTKKPAATPNDELVELLTEKILQRLG